MDDHLTAEEIVTWLRLVAEHQEDDIEELWIDYGSDGGE